MSRVVDFWFDFSSNYSYLSVMRIEREAAARGVEVRWKPFLLGPVFQALGWQGPPFLVQQAKARYVWEQDMPRQCAKYGLPWRRPSAFPRRAILPSRVALVADEEPWVGDFCRGVMQLNFAEDREVDGPDAVAAVLAHLGQPAAQIIRRAEAAENKLRLRLQTELARELGIFGAPTFFVGGAMFWGNDRLEDALELAAAADPA